MESVKYFDPAEGGGVVEADGYGAYVSADDFDRVTAERNALQIMLNDREEQVHSLEQRRHAEQQACQAAERRVVELVGLVQGWLDLFPKQGVAGGPITTMKERTVSALNHTAEAVSHE